ncbi:MAG: aminotransferase class I/II-fold pyridoxal phosphate-dependent enzyme [Dehalococcoidia bacterium]|nr:MAG: aminotransferase class I/II-fold pyridoxal phosphate-dependent enzyme [Dehalococcoidia bacterium]
MTEAYSIATKDFSGVISQKLSKVSPSGIRRFFDLTSSMEGAISLGVGEPDFVTPWHVREAAIHSLEKGYTMYTSNYGLFELRQEVAQNLKSHHGLSYDPDCELLITVGVSEGLDLALRTILDPGDEVIMPDPCYVAYPAGTILAGGVPILTPTHQQNDFKIRATDIESKITKRTKAILIGYPANPTGAVMPKEELGKIAKLAQRYSLLVISDEIYARLVYGTEHSCFACLPDMKEQTILLGGFSKAYAMTGWRIGYAAANHQIIEAMTKIHQYSMLCAPIPSQMAAIEALRNGESAIEGMVREYDKRRRIMLKRLNEIGLTCFEPKGAFYAFPSIEVTGMTSEEFAEKLLIEEKVVVVPGSAFGECGEGFVRCSYATSLANIEEATHRMGRFVARARQRHAPNQGAGGASSSP